MTTLLILLVLQQPASPAAPPQPSAPLPPATQPAATQPAQPVYDEGPLRTVITAARETRLVLLEPPPGGQTPESELLMQFRVSGADIKHVVRIGNVILEQVTDDSGGELVQPDQYTDADRKMTRPSGVPAERLRETGLLLVGRSDAAARSATTLEKVRGSVLLVLAEKPPEQVTVDSVATQTGKELAHPRLKEFGLTVKVVAPEEVADPPANVRYLALQFSKRTTLRNVSFFDANMKPVRTRETEGKTTAGDPVWIYAFPNEAALSADTQLVLDVYPSAEERTIQIDISDFKLP